jgi:hypothetical protein
VKRIGERGFVESSALDENIVQLVSSMYKPKDSRFLCGWRFMYGNENELGVCSSVSGVSTAGNRRLHTGYYNKLILLGAEPEQLDFIILV